jgi:hypothetical protein
MKRRALVITLLAACSGGTSNAPPPAAPETPTARRVEKDGPSRCDEYDEVVAAYVQCDKLPQAMRAHAQDDHDQGLANRTETSCMLATTPLRQLYNDNGCYTLQPLEAPAPSDGSGPALDARLSSCAQAIAIYEAMAVCEAVPQETRDEVNYAIESMRGMWQTSPDMPDDEAAAIDESCAQSLDSLREQLASAGCAD